MINTKSLPIRFFQTVVFGTHKTQKRMSKQTTLMAFTVKTNAKDLFDKDKVEKKKAIVTRLVPDAEPAHVVYTHAK